MNAQEILAKHKAINAVKGPRPHLAGLTKMLEKNGTRLAVADLNRAITALTELRNANATFEAQVAQAKAEVAAQEAAAAQAAANAAQAAAAPVAA